MPKDTSQSFTFRPHRESLGQMENFRFDKIRIKIFVLQSFVWQPLETVPALSFPQGKLVPFRKQIGT